MDPETLAVLAGTATFAAASLTWIGYSAKYGGASPLQLVNPIPRAWRRSVCQWFERRGQRTLTSSEETSFQQEFGREANLKAWDQQFLELCVSIGIPCKTCRHEVAQGTMHFGGTWWYHRKDGRIYCSAVDHGFAHEDLEKAGQAIRPDFTVTAEEAEALRDVRRLPAPWPGKPPKSVPNGGIGNANRMFERDHLGELHEIKNYAGETVGHTVRQFQPMTTDVAEALQDMVSQMDARDRRRTRSASDSLGPRTDDDRQPGEPPSAWHARLKHLGYRETSTGQMKHKTTGRIAQP